MKIWDISGFNETDLGDAIANGFVVRRKHPVYDLWILNYTDRAQYTSGVWNETVLNCRGLIHDADFNIVARPFKKFFNYGQTGAAEIALDERVYVTDKADGSLGIIYPIPGGGYAVATRGSFNSPQAVKATEMLQDIRMKQQYFFAVEGVTPLVEIIYPDNRIVLDYGQNEKLILLAAIDNESGYIYNPLFASSMLLWNPRDVIKSFEYETLAEALAAPPRKNAEGLVVRAGDRIIKIKQEDYVLLHRLVTGLNERAVWEHLMTHDGEYQSMMDGLPDEFHGWVKEKAEALLFKFWALSSMSKTMFEAIHVDGEDRGTFARKAVEYPELRAYLFMLLDGKDISQAVWKALKPKGETKMVERGEDVA